MVFGYVNGAADSIAACRSGRARQEVLEVSLNMSNPPKECRQQVLACVRLAQASTSAKDRVAFAKLAKLWLSLASDLEDLDRQLKSEPDKRKTG